MRKGQSDSDLAPKRKPGQKDRAHLTRCGAIYSENVKKQWFVWHLVSRISGSRAPSIALVGVGIDPPQNLLKMAFHRLIAQAGPAPQRIRVADQDRAAAGLQ